jgi:uncharacterized protein (DUF983 family)
MTSKGTKLYSIFKNKCPRCQEGNFFETNQAYHMAKFDKMKPKCETCGLDFEREPGYYYGAMYVSYGINVALFVSVWVASAVLLPDDTSVWWTIGAIGVLSVLLFPVIFRFSRIIWINLFVKYNKDYTSHASPLANTKTSEI